MRECWTHLLFFIPLSESFSHVMLPRRLHIQRSSFEPNAEEDIPGNIWYSAHVPALTYYYPTTLLSFIRTLRSGDEVIGHAHELITEADSSTRAFTFDGRSRCGVKNLSFKDGGERISFDSGRHPFCANGFDPSRIRRHGVAFISRTGHCPRRRSFARPGQGVCFRAESLRPTTSHWPHMHPLSHPSASFV